jgi:hypothetical protein
MVVRAGGVHDQVRAAQAQLVQQCVHRRTLGRRAPSLPLAHRWKVGC